MANTRSMMQRRASVFRWLAVVSFIAAFIAYYLYAFVPTKLAFFIPPSWIVNWIPSVLVTFIPPNYLINLTPIVFTVWIWGLALAALFSFISWRNGVAIKEAIRHEEVMEGLKVIYKILSSP